jgi:hypothetical protein
MADIEFTDDDEGKRVLNQDGNEIGRITEVRGGTAYVDADPDMFDTIRSKLGWGDAGEDSYPLEEDDVSEITDDAIRLRRF